MASCGKKLLDHAGVAAQHRDRQIAKASVLGEYGQQRFNDPRAKTVADDHAVDVAGMKRPRRALDAECADEADAFADRDRQLRIIPAAARDQDRRFIERIVGRHFRHRLAVRRQRFHAAQHRAVERANPRRGAESANDPRRRHVCGNRQRLRHRRRAVLVHAGDDRRKRAAGGVKPLGQRVGMIVGAFAIGARPGQHHRFRLDRSDRGNSVRPAGFDDWEGARRAQSLDDIRRRAVGNDDERTLQRHGGMRTFFEAQP